MTQHFRHLKWQVLVWVASLFGACFFATTALASTQSSVLALSCPLTQLTQPDSNGSTCGLAPQHGALSAYLDIAVARGRAAFTSEIKAPIFDLNALYAENRSALMTNNGFHSAFAFKPPAGGLAIGTPSMCCPDLRRLPSGPPARFRLGSDTVLQGSAAFGAVIYVAMLSRLDRKRKRRRFAYSSATKARKTLPKLRLMTRQLITESVKPRGTIPRLPLRVLRNDWRVQTVRPTG